MPTTDLVFTCHDCGQTYRGPIEHPGGTDGDKEAATLYITGQRRQDAARGPICPMCLAQWTRALSGDHFDRCLAAAKHREQRAGKPVQVYSQHLRGRSPGNDENGKPLPGTAQGVWVCSTGRYQEIPREAKTTRPRHDAWKRIGGVA